MPYRRSALPKVLLFLGFVGLFLVFKYQSALQSSWGGVLEKVKIYFDNFFYQSPVPKRYPPLSFLEQETELKLYIGDPFRDFIQSEWDEFWKIIYGTFPDEESRQPGMPARMRQLTTDEIAYKLTQNYPQPFAYFKDSHWQLFFGIALKKK
jgi:hypothetical protein